MGHCDTLLPPNFTLTILEQSCCQPKAHLADGLVAGSYQTLKCSTARWTLLCTAVGYSSRLCAARMSKCEAGACCRGAVVVKSFSACTAKESEGIDKSSLKGS